MTRRLGSIDIFVETRIKTTFRGVESRTHCQHTLAFFLIFFSLNLPLFAGTALKKCKLVFNNGVILNWVPAAITPEDQQRGLSNHRKADHGMIFIYPEAKKLYFWMHHTYIPLTIGFFNENKKLFQIENMAPNTDFIHKSNEDALYALELKQGEFSKLGLKKGSKLKQLYCQ